MMKPIRIVPDLPINYNQAKDFFDSGLIYTIFPLKMRVFYFTTVIGNGGIFSGLNFVKDSAEGLILVKNYSITYLIKRLFREKNIVKPFGKFLVFFDKWTSNHYHLHCDFLPRLLLYAPTEISHLTLVIPDTNYMKHVGLPLIEKLGYYFKSVIFLKENENLLTLSKVHYIYKTHTSGYSNPILNLKLKENFSRTIARYEIEKTPRIYAKRGNKYGRKVLNEREVIDYLASKHGFKVIDFDELKTFDAIQIMQSCQILVGMHGAALTNAFYMPKGSYLLEFRWNGKHHNHCYWHLASSVELKYFAVFGISDDDSKLLEGQGCNLTIPIASLEEAMKIVNNQINKTSNADKYV